MKDINNKPPNAGIMPSRTMGGWKAGRPIGRERPMPGTVKTERLGFETGPAFGAPGIHDASCFLIDQVEIGGITVETGEKRRNIRRNRISFVPPFYGFLRLFTPNGKRFCAAGKVGGSWEEFYAAPRVNMTPEKLFTNPRFAVNLANSHKFYA
jgi:hypothetical protein